MLSKSFILLAIALVSTISPTTAIAVPGGGATLERRMNYPIDKGCGVAGTPSYQLIQIAILDMQSYAQEAALSKNSQL